MFWYGNVTAREDGCFTHCKENVEAKCDWCGTPHVLTPEEVAT